MGVKGLWKYLCKNDVRLKTLRLSETARKMDPLVPVLVCDLIGIFYWLIEQLHTAKVKIKEYSMYTAIYGGDFNDYRNRIEGFVDALRHIGIEPMFFLDGPPASATDTDDTDVDINKQSLRLSTAVERHKRRLACMDVYAKVCGYDRKTEVRYEKRIKKALLFDELVQALKNRRVDVVTCYGQADRFMARYARDNEDKVCGILTNDTDLAFMPGCPMIHIKVFDFNNDLKLNTGKMEVRPREITCKVLTSEILARHFGIDKACLPALSILCGNDFTTPLNNICGISDMFGHPVPKTAKSFIQRNMVECKLSDTFLKIHQIEDKCLMMSYEHRDAYIKAVAYSYMFYTLTPVDPDIGSDHHSEDVDHPATACCPPQLPKSELYLRRTPLDSFLLSLNSTGDVTIWRNEIEQLDPEQPCIHETTLPIRRLMYHLTQVESIEECGQHSVCEFRRTTIDLSICPYSRPVGSRVLESLKQLPEQQKLYFVYFAMCKSDIPVPIAVGTHRCSISTVLTCSCLMYAKRNNIVPSEYVMPLLLACLSCAQGKTPPPTTSRPGPKGVTIAAQFMTVLQHVRWLASLVGLHNLPLPSTIFQPYVYIPLHDVAFRITQKDKFRGEVEVLKAYYDFLAKEKAVIDLMEFISDDDGGDVYGTFFDITRRFESVVEMLSTVV